MKIKIILAFFLIALFPQFSLAETQATSSQEVLTPNTSALQVPEMPHLLTKIQEAKQKLADVKLNFQLNPVYNKKKKLTGHKLGLKDIFVAIYQPDTGSIFVTGAMQNGKKFTFPDKNYDISLISFNGVNSKFKVNKPENSYVLALKYLITPVETGSKKSIEEAMYEAIYIPSNQSLDKDEIVAYGEKYIGAIIDKAASDLANIESSSIPGKKIPEAIPPSLIRALVYAEHTDTSAVLKGETEKTIRQLNVLFAANQGDAYKYSVSSAGARGIAQFMPGTYASLVKRKPEASLIGDFVQGMSDHYNSIKAMYLLIDDYAGAVRNKATGGFAEGSVFDYGAASYNGGTTRVSRAVNALGPSWNEDQGQKISQLKQHLSSLKSQIKKTTDKKTKILLQQELDKSKNELSDLEASALRTETVNYLKKIYKVIPHFNSQLAKS